MILALLLQITTQSLVDEMNDLDRLTRPAEYTCRQFSSYERSSDPFANGDCGHYLRVEKGEHVMAEADGPGAIVRIWSANPQGTLRIYLDGAVAVEEDFQKLLSAEMTSLGGNLYRPFPYQRSMKVTCSKGGQYYHVQIRTWPAGTKVETYSPAKVPELRVAPVGEVTTESELRGPGVVRRIEIALPSDEKELRSRTLRITVDGELTVCCPLGDFFGTAPGRTPYESLPLGITKEGVGWCAFPMPFERSFKIEGAAATMRVTRDSRPLRFHAGWRGSNALKTRPMSHWPVLRCEGRGRYVGTFLAVTNPVRAWWGEGDEKVYIDGETFPSFFGTGTEDYFGYAWCSPQLFQAPYHNQTRCDGPQNRGHTAVARYHILDDIPFAKSIRFDLEVWHWADCTMGWSTVAFWYAEPGSKHDFAPPADADREILPLPEARRVDGAIEGEKMEIVEKSGTVEPQELGEEYSGETHLWWRDAKPGAVLRLRFDAKEADRLVLAFTQAPDYGIVKITVNGKELGELDFWADRVKPSGEREFAVPVRAKGNEIRIEITGTNPKARPKNYMFGLDYVRVPK